MRAGITVQWDREKSALSNYVFKVDGAFRKSNFFTVVRGIEFYTIKAEGYEGGTNIKAKTNEEAIKLYFSIQSDLKQHVFIYEGFSFYLLERASEFDVTFYLTDGLYKVIIRKSVIGAAHPVVMLVTAYREEELAKIAMRPLLKVKKTLSMDIKRNLKKTYGLRYDYAHKCWFSPADQIENARLYLIEKGGMQNDRTKS